jgi:peptidoglycan/LPS O-acetylase OafA/YrhL
LAALAFVLTVTALLLPWWRYTVDDGTFTTRFDFHAFRPDPPATTTWAPWATGVLAAIAALLLFVRVAGNSHQHEPASWRRDLVVSTALLAVALASCLFWPGPTVPWFWGGRTTTDPGTGVSNIEAAMPGLGWWVAVVALVLAAFASWNARRQPDGSTAGGTTPK